MAIVSERINAPHDLMRARAYITCKRVRICIEISRYTYIRIRIIKNLKSVVVTVLVLALTTAVQ